MLFVDASFLPRSDQALGGASDNTRDDAGGDEERVGTGQVSRNIDISDRDNDTSHHVDNENDVNNSEDSTIT